MKNKKLILITGISFVGIFIVGLVLSFILNKNNDTPQISFDTYIATNIGQIEDKGNYNIAQKKNVYSSENMSKECTNIMDNIVECFTEFPVGYNPYDPYDKYPSLGDAINGYDACYCGFSGMNYDFLIICKRISTQIYSFAVIFSDSVNVFGTDFIDSIECQNIINNL